MARIHITTMDDIRSQLTLQTWMSAAFPTGAFTCSHGLETAIEDGRIQDEKTCKAWIASLIEHGSLWNDALITVNAYKLADRTLQDNLNELNQLSLALCCGAERLRETTQLGLAFAKAADTISKQTRSALTLLEAPVSLPVVVGAQGALSGIPLKQLLPASLQASSSNLVWICTRLVPLGQSVALNVIAELQETISLTTERALNSSLDDIGSSTILADLASIEHEALRSRICIT